MDEENFQALNEMHEIEHQLEDALRRLILLLLEGEDVPDGVGEDGVLVHWYTAFSFHTERGQVGTAGIGPFGQPNYVSLGLLTDAIGKVELKEQHGDNYRRGC